MDAVIALALLAAASGEPALAGGPDAPRVRVEHRVEYGRAYRREYSHAYRRAHQAGPGWTVSRAGGGLVHPVPGHHGPARSHSHADRGEAGAVRAGDPVTLGAAFFFAPQAGGVERPAPVLVYGQRGVLVISPGSAPVSAGQAAAARGLPRG
jgi:hypothetical protein